MPPEIAKKARQQMEKVTRLLRAFRLTQSGNTVRISGKWQVKDIEDILEEVRGMIPGGP